MKAMSHVSQNNETAESELFKLRIFAAFGTALLYLFLVINARAQDLKVITIGLNSTAAQVAR